jgi:predicted helicase
LYRPILYRPFDKQYTYFTDRSKGFLARPVYNVMKHLTHKDSTKNLGLIVGQSGQVVGDMPWNLGFITDTIVDLNVFYRGGGYVYPLYLNLQEETQYTDAKEVRLKVNEQPIKPNFNDSVMKKVTKGLKFEPSPENMLGYIYAFLYSPSYRKKYSEFLKRDFPHIPYPNDKKRFNNLAQKGKELMHLHLMQEIDCHKSNKAFPFSGNGSTNKVECNLWTKGSIYINDSQYYKNVSEKIWNFYIGGYQPAQKWLKDHKGITLDFESITHYSKILYVIQRTLQIMDEIDKI